MQPESESEQGTAGEDSGASDTDGGADTGQLRAKIRALTKTLSVLTEEKNTMQVFSRAWGKKDKERKEKEASENKNKKKTKKKKKRRNVWCRGWWKKQKWNRIPQQSRSELSV